MRPVFLCDAVRTPIGRYGGALATMCIGAGQGVALALERV